MSSWYSIRNKTGSFYNIIKEFFSIKFMMEGFSLAHFIIYKRRGSFYQDLVHIIGWFHSIMDEIHVIIIKSFFDYFN